MNSSFPVACGLSAAVASVVVAPSEASASGTVTYNASLCQSATTQNGIIFADVDSNTGQLANEVDQGQTLSYVCPVASDSGAPTYPKYATGIVAYAWSAGINSVFIADCRSFAVGGAAACGPGKSSSNSSPQVVTFDYANYAPGWANGLPSDGYYIKLVFNHFDALFAYGYTY